MCVSIKRIIHRFWVLGHVYIYPWIILFYIKNSDFCKEYTHGNLKLTSPQIQKDIVRSIARETTKAIFDKVNIELLLCVAFLSLRDLFSKFDKKKLICLAQFYPSKFSLFN
jgi:hypothetical protein